MWSLNDFSQDHLSEDVEADVAVQVDVGMIHFSLAFHLQVEDKQSWDVKWANLGWLVRIGSPDLETEVELSVPVESLVRENDQLETQEIVRVRELRLAGLGQLQLIDVLQVIIFYLM